MYDENKSLATVEAPRNETIRERLQRRKSNLERELGELDKALSLLDQNPSFEEIHNALSTLGNRIL